MKNEQRIWNLEELKANPEFIVDSIGDWFNGNEGDCINSKMVGETVEWCEDNGWKVEDWMIATTTEKQEPKEGDWVYVWDGIKRPDNPEKRIFLFSPKNYNWCICVEGQHEEEYKNGYNFRNCKWKNFELIPQKTPQEEIADKVGKTIEELKEIFKS